MGHRTHHHRLRHRPGLSRSNVVLWAKQALEKGDPIRVVDDQWRMPTLAEDLADGCIPHCPAGATGTFHLSGPDGMEHPGAGGTCRCLLRAGHHRQVTPVKSDTLGQPAGVLPDRFRAGQGAP